MNREVLTCVFWAGLLAARGACAQVPAEERIPIRDPDRLHSLGFPRDANNVYLWSRADTGPGGGHATSTKAVETWGTAVGYTTIFAYELQGYYEPLENWSRTLLETQLLDNSGLDSSQAHAQVVVPDGARLTSFQSWAYDASSSMDLTYRIWETCQPYGSGDPDQTLIAENSTLGSPGNIVGSKSLQDLTVNNEDCTYTAEVAFPPVADAGATVALRKLRFTWLRQVSAPPASPTFGDVPTTHQFYQFVEALAKSAITGGCGNGNFCPDAPLTRGQMAAFLSKALGLQWP